MTEVAVPVRIRVDIDRRINFAMQQNDVPVAKAIHLDNLGTEPLRDLELRLRAEPNFAEPWTTRIAIVPAGATYTVEAIELKLSPGYLGELTERVRGQLWIEVARGETTLTRIAEDVELLARDEWGGLSSLPEILSAFVVPNHPCVERVLHSAAELLEAWTGDPSLSGYQSKNPRRVYTTAAAIYAALEELGLTYINPPASYEEQGQRVRLPERILESGMATCLDLALLAASCLEQAGLNALLVLAKSHAVTGVWLIEECFPEAASDDGLRLRKRVELHEIAVFDPTGVTTRPSLNFENAESEAKRRLDSLDSFQCVIDVRRARIGRIRPLPERARATDATDRGAGAGGDRNATPTAPDVSGISVRTETHPGEVDSARETPATRLDRWRNKLLDLSLRNRLLNFKDSKKTLSVLCPDLAMLEDLLSAESTFEMLPRPADLGDQDPRDTAAHRRRTGVDGTQQLLLDQLKVRRLHSDATAEELDRRLTEIYRAARLGIEEGGASALYVAIGFLAWYESDSSDLRHLAPILLVPLELHRRSVRQGFTLRQGEDEPRINVTLLELLKQDHDLVIPGLDPLPQDESGLDVPEILSAVRYAVRDIRRWEVIEEARIGLFSFAKFLMWRDLAERSNDLMKNTVVAHLVSRPDQPFSGDRPSPAADRLDDECAPTDTFCPLPADSSQLAAVFAAAAGRSFVLEGPPGTGKSQTIANLIAHCLTQGKRVLFVSEKMAALDVVRRRLANIGLGGYCLELHSNTTQKREVVAQLEESLQRPEVDGEDAWVHEARLLAGLRDDLNAYARALHQTRTTGETVFQATSRLIGLRDVKRVALRWDSPESLNADGLGLLRDTVERLSTVARALDQVKDHPWETVRHEDWTPSWEEEVLDAISRLDECAEALRECARETAERLSLGGDGWSLVDLELMGELASVLMDSPAPPPPIVVRPQWDEIQVQVGAWIEHGRTRDKIRASLRQTYNDEIVRLDLDDLSARLARVRTSWWPASWWRRRPVRAALARVAKEGKAPAAVELATILEQARKLREEQARLDSASEDARVLLGRHWNDGEGQWDGIAKVRDWAGQLRNLATRAAGDDVELGTDLREKWAQVASEGRSLLRRDGSFGRLFLAFRDKLTAYKEVQRGAADLLDLDFDRCFGSPSSPDLLGTTRSRVMRWRQNSRQLRDWCAWRRARVEAFRRNLAALVEAYEAGDINAGDLRDVFERSYAQWWLAAVVGREPVLSHFFSPEHQRKIAEFRAVDDRYRKLTESVIASRLGENAPETHSTLLPNSEMGILKREIGRRRRHMSIRQLMQKIPNLLPRLKPCLMMSPISVAQYIDASYPPFDIVVFDEASQIPVWEAVGAIARGRQAVIVGDRKQLPPTSFFERAEREDEEGSDDELVEDLESILDDCTAAQIPCLSLSWHYRSRHESLIAFSNYHYYENRLLTFPSPDRDGMGVYWQHVPGGVYDKGKSRTNRVEADAVVQEVLRRLRDPQLSRYTIGVVTFGQAQQKLIEDLLDAARSRDPGLEPYFAEEAHEPVFVKNLENVQGDERDVILFSICFGADSVGRISMNFGPMNREGGERRLNVAITRARREVGVYSTLRGEQIDLARTRARGVRDLKWFLEYAERGPSAIAAAVSLDDQRDFESPFEEAVYDALVRRGWRVHKQVGCARYRIDLALIDPDSPGRFLLGVECDGANYHRAKTARDRDKLREGILRDLGWELHRIWSTDWWTDPDREVRKLEEALDRAKKAKKDPAGGGARHELLRDAIEVRHLVPDQPIRPPAATPGSVSEQLESYRSTPVGRGQGSQSDFYEASAVRRVQSLIAAVVAQEGPVSLPLAARRVAAFWGFERVRSNAIERIRALVSSSQIRVQVTEAGEFLWPVSIDPQTYLLFRVSDATDASLRSPEDLPLEEVANAALHVLQGAISAPVDDVIRETARLFGFLRLGSKVEERMRQGVDLLVQRRLARRDGASIRLVS